MIHAPIFSKPRAANWLSGVGRAALLAGRGTKRLGLEEPLKNRFSSYAERIIQALIRTGAETI